MKEREGNDSNVAVIHQTIQLINHSINKPNVPDRKGSSNGKRFSQLRQY